MRVQIVLDVRWTTLFGFVLFAASGCGGGGSTNHPGPEPGPDVVVALPDVSYPDLAETRTDHAPAQDPAADPLGKDDGADPSGQDVEAGPADDPGPNDPSVGLDPGPGDTKPDAGPTPSCGDEVCDPLRENCGSCPQDCGTCPQDPCGDAQCDLAGGENCATCPKDCGACPKCGDGTCTAENETCESCPQDCGPCPPACGDRECNGEETCLTCPEDCGPCQPACPDGFCNGDETCSTCPLDCGACPASCGDGDCNGVENCTSCPEDCGGCAETCGDTVCSAEESCQSCPLDCGVCAPTLWFHADWSETLDAPIVAGGDLRIRYDLERLTECRQTHNGYPGWTITVFYTADLSQPAQEVQVVMHTPQGQSLPFEPVIQVPADAQNLWFWAKNTGVEGCVAWDSDYGKNYMMPVFQTAQLSQAVGWAGWGGGAIDFAYWKESGPVSMGDVDPVWCFESLWGAEVTTAVRVQVYVAGITDRVYQNSAVSAEVAHTAVAAVVETNFKQGGGAPSSAPGRVPMEFEFQKDNNFFYRWHFGSFGYVWNPGGPPLEGLYAYRLELRTANGPSTWIGRPNDSPSVPRRLVYAKDPSTGCGLFPSNPPPDLCP